MTREEAIEWIENIKEKYIRGGDEEFDEKRKTALDMAIQALLKMDWIPVSERLPRPYEQVLRTVKFFVWNCTSHTYIDIGTICPSSKDVIAWMPLPEPYKTEREGEKPWH